MSLEIVARKLAALVLGSLALCSVACSGGDDARTYTGTDLEASATPTPVNAATATTSCEAGAVRSCTIWLGQHGDLSNCIHGVDVCADGAWTGCIDEDTISSDPNLYASLAGDK